MHRLQLHPSLLSIGIDESTAIVVRQDKFEIIGRGPEAFLQFVGSRSVPRILANSAVSNDEESSVARLPERKQRYWGLQPCRLVTCNANP